MNHSIAANASVIDPVCGMTIDSAGAVGSSSFNGQAYSFCSRGCQTKFDASPASYIETGATSETASCCSNSHSCC
jgi:P-type Cu+ transporter